MNKDYKTIYSHLQDELSKRIFEKRLLFTETGDCRYLMEMMGLIPEADAFWKSIQDTTKEIIIFGAGAWGKELVDFFPIGWTAFLDNYCNESEYHGVPIIRFDDYLESHKNAFIILTARLHYQSMLDQLYKANIDRELIINMGKSIDDLSKRQYFDLPALPHAKDEVFVDCGCLDGQTSSAFIRWAGDDYKKIYAFEPDPAQIQKCRDFFSDKKGEVFELGTWNEKCQLHFNGFLEGSSKIDGSGEISINVDRIDHILNDQIPTFIKMDIEGAEKNALIGAENLIKAHHPKLAISIYHKPEDIYEIPLLLLEYNPNYVFYIRHYSVAASETVLYAIDL